MTLIAARSVIRAVIAAVTRSGCGRGGRFHQSQHPHVSLYSLYLSLNSNTTTIHMYNDRGLSMQRAFSARF